MRWAAVATLVACGVASAHDRSVSYSRWMLDPSGAAVEVRVTQLDLTRLGAAGDDFRAADVARAVRLFAADAPCAPAGTPAARATADGWVVYAWRVACPAGARTITSRLLLDVAPSHLHFARVVAADGSVVERVLTEAEPRWTLDGAPGASFARFVALGVAHVATGWAHLAFVLGLLLLAGSLAEVATLVTAFTVAHSTTMALATLGAVPVVPGVVAALIGYSIALVALERAWRLGGRDRATPWLAAAVPLATALLGGPAMPLVGLALFGACYLGLAGAAARPVRLRATLAFAFGLVHGLGFARELQALELGPARVPALLGFNLGVEAGQLAVVCAAWPVLRGLARRPAAARLATEVGSAALVAVGVYLFATGAIGR